MSCAELYKDRTVNVKTNQSAFLIKNTAAYNEPTVMQFTTTRHTFVRFTLTKGVVKTGEISCMPFSTAYRSQHRLAGTKLTP
jgi:hypothetical protein